MKKAKGEGELLRAYLRDEKIHQGDLREKLGASRGAIESYAEGRNKPKVDIANRAANYFNLTTDQVLNQKLTAEDLQVTGRTGTIAEVKLQAANREIELLKQTVEDLRFTIELLKKI